MKYRAMIFAGFLFIVWGRCQAAPRTYDVSHPPEKSVVTFTSKALNEEFDGVAEKFHGLLNLDFDQPNLGLSGKFSVPVESMNTGISLRDKHMMSKDWLDQARYPLIRLELISVDLKSVVKTAPHRWTLRAKGLLSIKGQSKEVEVPAVVTVDPKTAERVTVEAQFVVHLNDFNIHGPAGLRMIGVRVSPDVRVNVKLKGRAQTGW